MSDQTAYTAHSSLAMAASGVIATDITNLQNAFTTLQSAVSGLISASKTHPREPISNFSSSLSTVQTDTTNLATAMNQLLTDLNTSVSIVVTANGSIVITGGGQEVIVC